MSSLTIPVENNTWEYAGSGQEAAKGKTAALAKERPVSAPEPDVNVVVAIPAYNEEVAIGSVVLRALKYTQRVVVIDDGSKDNTAEIARLAGCEVIEHPRNQGKGAAIRNAFEYGKSIGADVLILIDGDGQHNPDEIPALLAPILKGEADMVNGSRFISGNGNNVPKYRRLGQEVLTMATNTGTKLNITDTQNGFRAFSKNTFDCFSFHENGMAIESEMLMDAARANIRITEVPIDVRYDVNGSTYNPITHGFSVLGKVINLVSRRRPLLFFCVPGALVLSLSLVFIFLTFGSLASAGNLSLVYEIAGIACILLGILSIFTGLILFALQRDKNKN